MDTKAGRTDRIVAHRLACVVAIVVFLSALLAPGTVSAAPHAQSTVNLSAEPFFGGVFKYGEWLPLRVSVSNQGADLQAEVRVVVGQGAARVTYAAPAPMATGARKEIILYTLPPSYVRSLKVELVEGDRVVAEAEAAVAPVRNITYLVGVIAADPEPYGIVEGLKFAEHERSMKLAPMRLRDLPERAHGLRSFDAIVIGGTDTTELSPAQIAALRQWIAGGGRLVVGGGSAAERVRAGLPEGLRPAAITRRTMRSTAALAAYAGAPAPAVSDYVSAAGTFGDALLEEDGVSLISEQRLGRGAVDYLAFDPAEAPFGSWTGMRGVWRRLFSPGSIYPTNLPPDASEGQMLAQRLGYALTNLPSLDLPSVRWLAILLAVYILLVGPVNYLFLRRLKRLDWAWGTIPALTVLFAGVAFGSGYALRGNDLVLNQITMINITSPGSPVLARTFVGLFSPVRGAYSLTSEPGAVLSPVNSEPNRFGDGPFQPGALEIVDGEAMRVRNLQIDQWGMQSFQAEAYLPAAEWGIDAGLSFTSAGVEGRLRNPTAHDLTDLVLVVGGRFARLGDLAAGAELPVSVQLEGGGQGKAPFPYALFENQMQAAGARGPNRELMAKQNLLQSTFDMKGGETATEGMMLIAWFKDRPVPISVVDRAAGLQSMGLLIAALTLDLSGPEVTLPPGAVAARVSAMQNEAGICGPGARVYVGNGEARIQYTVPPELRSARVVELTLQVESSQGIPTGQEVGINHTVAIYDVAGETWSELPMLKQGANVISEPGRFVDNRDGTVRLRVKGQAQQGDCVLYDLGLKARR